LHIQSNSGSENRPRLGVKKPSLKCLPLAALSIILALLIVTPSTGFSNDKKKDPDEIGNRDVGKGVNFYSLEKEIGLGKVLAQEVERQAKIINDPVIAEYVNRVGQEPGPQLRCEGTVHDPRDRQRRGECVRLAGRILLRELWPDS
jgi:hypothetical protein